MPISDFYLVTCLHVHDSVCILGIMFSPRGAFSEVHRAVDQETHKEYAIKVIKKDALKGKEEALQMEVQVLQK